MTEHSYTLVLNGSEARLQIVVGHGSSLLFSQEWFTPRQGMQVLVPALSEGLARMHTSLDSIGRIAVVRGPGSFTGVRLVLSTALGLARSLGIPMAGIDYLQALATDAAPLIEGQTWAVTHARRGLVHIQGFGATDPEDGPIELGQPAPASLDEAVQMIRGTCVSSVLLGSGIRKNETFFREALPRATILPARFDHPAPETLLFLAEQQEYSFSPVVPCYLRGCDAEENLPSIARKKGLDPAKATQTLAELTKASGISTK